jgi:hypothetical protein
MSQLLLAAQKLKDSLVKDDNLAAPSASATASSSSALRRASYDLFDHSHAAQKRQNASQAALEEARKLVLAAQAEAGERNLQRLANPRRNSYSSRNNTSAALKARQEDIALYTVNTTVAAAAALVAEADASNGMLNMYPNVPEKYMKYLNHTSTPTSQFNKRDTYFWMEDIEHNGGMPFGNDKGYSVFRNVKSYGAKGDGVTE